MILGQKTKVKNKNHQLKSSFKTKQKKNNQSITEFIAND